MFFFTKPSDDAVRDIVNRSRGSSFSYRHVGITKHGLTVAPGGFLLDTYGAELGRGKALFERAKALLASIDNYPPSFTSVVKLQDEVTPGAVFATVASHLGFYSVHPCKVIYVIDDEPTKRFGFGFGTLEGHAEHGEERFLVALDDHERVRYEVQAFSRPAGLVTRMAAPVTRAYQLRFQRETLDTMRHRCAG